MTSNMKRAREEAADWLFRLELGLSTDDESALAAWRAASPDNATAWTEAKAALDEIGALDDPLLDAMRIDALSARPAPRSRRPWERALSAIAATVLVGVIGVVAWRAMAPSHPGQEIAATAPPAFSAGDQAQTITLADGSQAVLDPQSALAVRFTNARRDLRLLRGRALFEVRHDGRPFAVAADDTTTTATGTRFSVALTSEGAMAVLERGQVIVTRLGDTTALTLAPGETLVAVHGKPMTVTKAVQRSPKTAAPTYVEFRDTPLTQAAEQIARGSSTPIHVIGGAGLLKVTGRFKLGDPLGFVRAVTEILPVRQRPSRDGGVDLILNEPQNSARIDSTNRRPRGSP